MTTGKNTNGDLREAAIDWLLRLRDAPQDESLKAQFHCWLALDPKHRQMFERIERLMGDASQLLASDPGFVGRAAQSKSPASRGTLMAAMSVFVITTGGFFIADGPIRLRADAISGTGEQQSITLQDGSTLQLNASSAVAFEFGTQERRIVLLKGEAYVEVARDTQRPFVVEADGGTTTALGTAFNVNLTQEGTSVTVVEHSVIVDGGRGNVPVRIGEQQQVSYDAEGRVGPIETVDPETAAAWREGRLVFNDRTIGSVIEELGRYVPGSIVISQDNIRQRRVSGSFNLADPDAVLRDLAAAFNVGVTHIGPYLTVLHQ